MHVAFSGQFSPWLDSDAACLPVKRCISLGGAGALGVDYFKLPSCTQHITGLVHCAGRTSVFADVVSEILRRDVTRRHADILDMCSDM